MEEGRDGGRMSRKEERHGRKDVNQDMMSRKNAKKGRKEGRRLERRKGGCIW
jgi:hypothetical protein